MTKSEDMDYRTHSVSEISKPPKYEEDLHSNCSPKHNEDEECSKVKKSRKKWILLGLSYANFWTAACFSLQAPFFPQEAERKGASATQYGLIFGVFELVVVIMSPLYARMMPRVKPRFLSITGVILEGIACALFGLLDLLPAGKTYIAMAFIVRILEGFAASAITTASFTITAAECQDTLATSFSMMETAFGFGLIIGPTIGGFLYQVGGFPLPFAVCGVCLLSAGLILIYALPPVEKVEIEHSRELKKFLFNCDVIIYTFAIITSLFFIGYNSATLEPHLRIFKLEPSILGLIFVINGGIYAFTTPLWGRFCDKGANPRIICLIGYVLVCVGALLIGPVPFIPLKTSLWLIIVSLIVIGLGMAAKLVAAFVGALQSTRERGFPDNVATYSMVSALFSSSCSAGAFVGPTIGGLLLDTVGYNNGTLVVLGIESIFLVALGIHILLQCKNKRNRNPEKSPLLGSTTYVTRRISNG